MGIDRINQTVTEFLERQKQQQLPLSERKRVNRLDELAERLTNDIWEWINAHNPAHGEAQHHSLQSEAVNVLVSVLAGELAVEELNPHWTAEIERHPTEENAMRFKVALDTRQREITGRLTEMLFALAMESAQAKSATRKETRP
jgi:hypothetical protein